MIPKPKGARVLLQVIEGVGQLQTSKDESEPWPKRTC